MYDKTERVYRCNWCTQEIKPDEVTTVIRKRNGKSKVIGHYHILCTPGG